jgi:hypothetical protein
VVAADVVHCGNVMAKPALLGRGCFAPTSLEAFLGWCATVERAREALCSFQ